MQCARGAPHHSVAISLGDTEYTVTIFVGDLLTLTHSLRRGIKGEH